MPRSPRLPSAEAFPEKQPENILLGLSLPCLGPEAGKSSRLGQGEVSPTSRAAKRKSNRFWVGLRLEKSESLAGMLKGSPFNPGDEMPRLREGKGTAVKFPLPPDAPRWIWASHWG